MGVLTGEELLRLYAEGTLKIVSTVEEIDFNPTDQIQPNSIDLRLAPLALRYRNKDQEIDILADQNTIDGYFEAFKIPIDGYVLQPSETIFSFFLEALFLATGQYIGRVIGRTTWARFGLSITCNQPNLPTGIGWVFPLQVTNNTNNPIRIYPYIYIGQLQIETITGCPTRYTGKYSDFFDWPYPKVDSREKALHHIRTVPPIPPRFLEDLSNTLGEILKEFTLSFTASEKKDLYGRLLAKRARLKTGWVIFWSLVVIATVFVSLFTTMKIAIVTIPGFVAIASTPPRWLINLIAKRLVR